MDYTLYIGNKNYSSWSMRPWVVMKHFQLNFNEKCVRFDVFDADSQFKKTVLPINPYGTVPILVDHNLVISDSLAICEYLADNHPTLNLWPSDRVQRAKARNLVTHMHSGFNQIRQYLWMNIEASLDEVGQILLRDHSLLSNEIVFFDQVLSTILQQSNDPFLFGQFSIADAFFAPMCLRMKTYHIKTSETLTGYIERICQQPSVASWISDAYAEKDFILVEEPYRAHR